LAQGWFQNTTSAKPFVIPSSVLAMAAALAGRRWSAKVAQQALLGGSRAGAMAAGPASGPAPFTGGTVLCFAAGAVCYTTQDRRSVALQGFVQQARENLTTDPHEKSALRSRRVIQQFKRDLVDLGPVPPIPVPGETAWRYQRGAADLAELCS